MRSLLVGGIVGGIVTLLLVKKFFDKRTAASDAASSSAVQSIGTAASDAASSSAVQSIGTAASDAASSSAVQSIGTAAIDVASPAVQSIRTAASDPVSVWCEWDDAASVVASDPTSSGRDYDVFLSFRGEDTRTSFSDHLYNAFVDRGIWTFRDNEEIPIGNDIKEELVSAILRSKIAIPIFSKDYASSHWCLRELAQIADCRKVTGQRQITVMPIFYHVDPSDVRKQTGCYEKAFQNHEKEFGQETVEGWMKALREIGELKGWHLEKTADGHEGKLIQLVIETVWSELIKGPMIVSDNLIGIHSHVEEMKKLLDMGSNNVQIVGIHGLGGIGKTTIAKCVYNAVYHHFERCSFMADAQETFQQRGLLHLQSQLIMNILNLKNPNITSVNEGIDVISQRFSNKKVLIVLDDVDHEIILNAMIRERGWFGIGSRIIITTRNMQVLVGHEVNRTYEPNEMDIDQSLQLFSEHAFKMDQPPKHYLDLSKDVVKTTGGLPLALDVIGSFLFQKEESVWKDMVKKLMKIPPKEVQKKLRISYDGLDHEEKQMFLDIACFFIGMDKNIACYIWDECDFFPEVGIEVLRLKSLVKIDDENELRMHSQLRDLGREIVRHENLKEPGKRSRLWLQQEALDVLSKQTGTQEVEGLCIDFGGRQNSQCLITKGFATMTKLRLLQVDYAQIAENCIHSFPELRWLSWKRCPIQFTPTNLRKLIVLDLSYSDITESWKGWNHIKEAVSLKVLNLSWCRKLSQTPDFSGNLQLEELILEYCENLATIHASIGCLKRLVKLNMKCCTRLRDLPADICELSSLKILDIKRTNIGWLPERFGCLEALTELRIDHTSIRKLPNSIGDLENLKTFTAEYCNIHPGGIRDIIRRLSSLEFLCFSRWGDRKKGESDPVEESAQTSTSQLSKTLPSSPGFIWGFNSLDCWSGRMKILPPMLSNQTTLEVLRVDDCRNLVEMPTTVDVLKSLKSLILQGSHIDAKLCEHEREILAFSESRNLRERSPNCYLKLETIERLEGLDSLERLEIMECHFLRKLPNLRALKKLKHLKFSSLGLSEIESLEELYSLEMLSIESCHLLRKFPKLSNSKSLWSIEIHDCKVLYEIKGLERLDYLEELYISACQSLRKIPQLPKKLRILGIRSCLLLSEIEGLQGLNSLEELYIKACRSLRKKHQLPKKLRKLNIHSCEQKLCKVEGVEDCGRLTTIFTSNMLKSLEELEEHPCIAMELLI